MGCEVIELNIQEDHVHMLVSIPPKESVSKLLAHNELLQSCNDRIPHFYGT